jgi:hypothetical protein
VLNNEGIARGTMSNQLEHSINAGILPLYYLCAIAGLIIIVGCLWLLHAGKIYIDRETQQPIQFELPGFGKIRTQTPVLILFAFGGALLVTAILEGNKLQAQQNSITHPVVVRGRVKSNAYPVRVYAVRDQDDFGAAREFNMHIPSLQLPPEPYKIVYTIQGRVVKDVPVDMLNARPGRAGQLDLQVDEVEIAAPSDIPLPPPYYPGGKINEGITLQNFMGHR